MRLEKLVKKLENNKRKQMPLEGKLDKLKIIGITGSRGKSTTAYFIHNYLKKMGYKSALYSSIMIDSPKSRFKNQEAMENPLYDDDMLLDAIKSSVNNDCDFLVLEVNERAISKGIVNDIEFDVRLLTNVIPDDNCIFGDYIKLKKSFIETSDNSIKIVAVIDDVTRELYQHHPNIVTVCTEHLRDYKLSKDCNIDYLLKPSEKIYSTINGLDFLISDQKNKILRECRSNMLFPFHGLNIVCAYAVLNELGIDLKAFDRFIKNIEVPGRDEVIEYKNNKIIVTPNLVPHLEHLKAYKDRKEINKIYLVTGSTGYDFVTWDDEFKTEAYKKAHEYDIKFAYDYLAKYVDKVFITKTDIGGVNAEDFLNYQASLLTGKVEYEIVSNRKKALINAIKELSNNDVLLVSGRGNREVMCITKNKIVKFKDKDEIIKIVKGEKYV